MDSYRNYQEFLTDLTDWGTKTLAQQNDFFPARSFLVLLDKAIKSADNGIFSPFLYTALS